MKCQICGKNEAVQDIYCNINGKKSRLNVCRDCSKQIADSIIPGHGSLYDSVGLGNLTSALYSLTGGHMPGAAEPEILQAVNKCPVCGMTYEMFASNGKLGCGECYKTFHDRLLRPLKQIHGTYEHVGKIPERAGGSLKTSKKLEKLKSQLDSAVLRQEFERAAELRDEIRKLKGDE